jgi:hypothetical protein
MVSIPNMKAFCYAVWLPLVHIVLMSPLIVLEEVKGWKLTSLVQRMEDYERPQPPGPPVTGSVGWPTESEYRPPTSVKAIYTAELPAALLVLWCGHVPGHTLAPPFNEPMLARFIRVRPRIVILDSLLLAAVYIQWWSIGWRLDRLRPERKRATWFHISAMVITASGAVMALLSRGTGVLELIAIIAAFVALLGMACDDPPGYSFFR